MTHLLLPALVAGPLHARLTLLARVGLHGLVIVTARTAGIALGGHAASLPFGARPVGPIQTAHGTGWAGRRGAASGHDARAAVHAGINAWGRTTPSDGAAWSKENGKKLASRRGRAKGAPKKANGATAKVCVAVEARNEVEYCVL